MKTTFGLVFAALFVTAALSAQLNAHSPQLPISLLPGQSTIYTYSGRLVSGQAGDSTGASAVLEIKADIILQAEAQSSSNGLQQTVAMQMTNIAVGKQAGAAASGSRILEHQEAPEYSAALSQPIRFIWAAGQVKSFEASASEPEWSINIKKAILSLLNVNLHPSKVIQSQESKIEKQNGIHRRQQIHMTTNPAEQMVVYPLYEDGIGGICETLYEIKQAPYAWALSEHQQAQSAHVLNITKTRIYDNCLTAPVLTKSNVDIRGAPVGCRAGRTVPLVAGYYPMGAEAEYQAYQGQFDADEAFQGATVGACADQQTKAGKKAAQSPVSQFNFVRYNISKHLEAGIARIDSIYAEGKTLLDSSSAIDSKKIMILVQQNVTLKTVQPFAEVIQPVASAIVHSELSFRLPKQQHNSKTSRLDMPYFQLFGKVSASELKALVPELLNSLAADIVAAESQLASGKKTTALQKAVELQNAMAVLDIASLESLFNSVATAGRSTRSSTAHQQIVRKLFLDILGSAGSTESALLAIRLFHQDKLTTFEAKELFEAIPQNLFLVETAVVEQYLNAFLSEKVQAQRHLASSMGIAVGKLVHEAVVKRGEQQQLAGDLAHGFGTSEEAMVRGRRAQASVAANENVGFSPMNQAYQQNYQQNYQQQQQKQTFREKMMQQSQGIHRIRRQAEAWESSNSNANSPHHYQQQELLQEAEQIDTILSVLATALRQAPTFHQKVTLIETLAHTSLPQVLPILAPYVNDQAPLSELPGYVIEDREAVAEERNFLRQVTVYALAHVARQHPAQVLALLMPLYENKAEPYEIRIAAFTIALNCRPSRAELERVAAQLHTEANRQIRSFVTSALHTAANASTTAAGWEDFAADARLAASLAPTKEPLGLHYSKMVGEGYYHQQAQQGLHYIAEWVSSNVSALPRSAYFQLGQQSNSGSAVKNVLLEVGYNAKGVDQLLSRVMEPNGIVSDAFEAMSQNSQTGVKDRRILSKRSAVDSNAAQALQSLKDKLNLVIRTGDEPKATVFFKLFERTAYYALDRHYLHSIIDQAEDSLKDMAAGLMAGRSAHYVKLVMPVQTVKVVPSELGLPVVITTRHPTIISVKVAKAKLQLDMPKSAILPVGANLTVQLTPALFHADYDFVFALAPTSSASPISSGTSSEAIGTHIDRTVRAAFPVEVSFGFKANKLAWSIVPTVPQEILHQHIAAKAFIASPATVASSPERDWLEADSVEIKSAQVPYAHEQSILKKQFGLGFRVQLQSESVEAVRPLSAHFFQAINSAKSRGPFAMMAETLIESATASSPRQLHVVLESDAEQQVTGYDFALAYKRVEDLDGKVVVSRADIAQIEEDANDNEIMSAEDIAALGKTSQRNAWTWAARAVAQQKQQNQNQQESEQLMTVSQAPTTEQVWEALFGAGQKFARQSVKNVARDLLASTAPVWTSHWAQTAQEQAQMERDIAAGATKVPAIIAHDIVLTAVARSSAAPRYYGANLLLVRSFDERTFWAKVNAFGRKASVSSYADKTDSAHQHQELCFDGVLSYPVLPSEFYYEPSATANLQAKMHARIAFGVDCSDKSSTLPLAKITINGLMEKTDEKVLKRSDLAQSASEGVSAEITAPATAWFYEQCQVDRAAGQSQSYACERALIEDSYFKQYQLEIDYQHIPASVQNFTRKLALATKVALYEHLQLDEALDEQSHQLKQNPANKIRITGQFSTKFGIGSAHQQLANLYISTPKENAAFEKISLPAMVRPLSALLPISEVYSNAIQQFEAVDRCVLMEGAIRTFDNVTIKVDEEQEINYQDKKAINSPIKSWSQQQCQYLVAKDCSAAERFSVFARNLDSEAKTKAVTVFIGATEVRLLPPTKSSRAAQAVVDGRTVQLHADAPQVVAKDVKSSSIYSSGKASNAASSIVLSLRPPRSQAAEPIIVLAAPATALTVLYDGTTVKVELANRRLYQGVTCGLCGDNNDEAEREFTGPDGCEYQRAADYIASYALAGAHCEQAPIPAGPKRCPTKVAKSQLPYIPAQVQVVSANQYTGNSGYVDLKEAAQKAKAARAATIQAQANAEELARLNQAQMEAVMARAPAASQAQFGGYPQYAGQQMPATPAQQSLLQRLRTYFVAQQDKVCFSIEPALSCIEGVSRPAALVQTRLNFHCLPANSISVQRLSVQAATSILPQFGRKVVHYSQFVAVPTVCVSNA